MDNTEEKVVQKDRLTLISLKELRIDGFQKKKQEPIMESLKALKTCPSSKRRFTNEGEAKKAARDGMLLRDTPPLDTYFCITCLLGILD